MVTRLSSAGDGVIFDDSGKAWSDEPAHLAHLGRGVDHLDDVVAYAVRNLGAVHVVPIRDALLVTFEPSVVSPLAAVAAFYEISARAAKPLILVYRGTEGHPDRCEVFNNAIEGLRRLNDAANLMGNAGRSPSLQTSVSPKQPGQDNRAKRPTVSVGTGTLNIKIRSSDRSIRVPRPLTSISDDDAWLRDLLNFWGNARNGRRLPSTEAMDALELLNIARGRAHIVETTNSNPAGYRFRLWGAANSYGAGYANRTLGEMPVGLMRDEAMGDYRQVVATGTPRYHLISVVEKNISYSYARLLLPLAQDHRRVDRLIVLISERRLPELGSP